MPRRIHSKSKSPKQIHKDLLDRVDKLVFEQIDQVMKSEHSDRRKLAFIVSIMNKQEDTVDELEAMFDEASCRHM